MERKVEVEARLDGMIHVDGVEVVADQGIL